MQIKLRKKISQMTETDWSEIMELYNGKGCIMQMKTLHYSLVPTSGMELIKLFLIEAHLC